MHPIDGFAMTQNASRRGRMGSGQLYGAMKSGSLQRRGGENGPAEVKVQVASENDGEVSPVPPDVLHGFGDLGNSDVPTSTAFQVKVVEH